MAEYFINNNTSNSPIASNVNPFASSPSNYGMFLNEGNSSLNTENANSDNLYETVLETQRAVKELMEQKKKTEEEKKLRYPVLSFPNFVHDNNTNNANIHSSQPPEKNLIFLEQKDEKSENDVKINQRLESFMSSVEKRLESMERNLQNLMSDFYAAHSSQNKFNEEFLKAISSLSNDISSAKSPSSSFTAPSLVVASNLPLAPGLGPSITPPQPQFNLAANFSDFEKKAQEETDQEIARRLQEEFDKQQRQQQPQPPSFGAPISSSPASNEPKEECPVCRVAFPIKTLPIHVESHFQQSTNPSSSATPSSTPSGQPPNSPSKQGGFFSKIFGKKDENPSPSPQPPQSQPPSQSIAQSQYFQPIPGYYPPTTSSARPQGVSSQPPPPQLYRLPPGQIPPQGSMVYRPPPPGTVVPWSPSNSVPQYINPDGSVYYPSPQPPK